MPTASPVLSEVIRQFTDGLRSEHLRDSDLLETFALNQNEVAFSDLVARHGPLVWGVCRRGLTDANDAEDAFQATFLALARQAQSLAERVADHETLAGWLYLTARRITNNVRRARLRRYEHERRAAADRNTLTAQPAEPAVSELGAVLDEELDRLPARFRDPLVLCYFQGRSHADAAKQIGCPVGTVSGRLARGCELLREGLAKRGVVLGIGQIGVAIAVAGSAGRVTAAIPPALAHTTVAAARTFAVGGAATTEAGRLAIGVAQATNWLKVKLSCLLIVAALGMTAAAALLSDEPTHAETPKDARVVASPEAKPHADAFGDALPDGAVARLGTLRFRTGKMGTASSVVFGANDKQLISVHGSDAIYVWDPITGRELRRLDGPQLCNAVSTTPDGRRLVAIGLTEAWAWDLAAEPPAVLWKAKVPKLIRGNIELSPDGRVVAIGGESKGNALLLDAATGETLRMITAGGSGLAFSADSKLLAVWVRATGIHADAKTEVTVWNVADGKQQYALPAGEGRVVVSSVAFSPDGKTIASVGADHVLRLTNAEDGKVRQTLSEEAAPHAHLGFLRDGTIVEAGSGQIRFWDVATGKQAKAAVKAVDAADAYRLSADGSKLARAGIFGVGLREVATGKEIGPNAGMPDGLVHSVTFTPDSKSLVMAVYSEAAGAALHLWDATNGRLRSQIEVGPKQIVWGLDVGADGSISGASVPLYQTPSPPIRIVTWDADLRRVRSAFNLPTGVRQEPLHPTNDSSHLVVGAA